jgi:hypothetical protein
MKPTNVQIVISEDILERLMNVSNAESVDDAIRLAVEHCLECGKR